MVHKRMFACSAWIHTDFLVHGMCNLHVSVYAFNVADVYCAISDPGQEILALPELYSVREESSVWLRSCLAFIGVEANHRMHVVIY